MHTDSLHYNKYLIPDTKNSPKEVHRKRLIVIAFEDDIKANKPLLEKMLAATQLDQEKDIETILLDRSKKYFFNDIHSTEQEQTILIFGVNPKQLVLNMEANYYRLMLIHQTNFIYSAQLSELESKNDHKKALWMAIKSALNIN